MALNIRNCCLGCGSGRDQVFLALRGRKINKINKNYNNDAGKGERVTTTLWRSIGLDHLDKALVRANEFAAVYGEESAASCSFVCDTLERL